MKRRLFNAAMISVTLALVTACVSQKTTWFEQRCQKIGLTKGTPDFEKCISRDKAWIDADQKRAVSTKQR